MALLSRWTLALSLAGSLGAQSLPDALAMVPEDASVLIILKESGITDRKFQAFTGRFGKGSSFHEWKTHFGRDLEGLGSGPALFVEQKRPEQKASSDVLLAPVANYKALLRELKAVPSGKLHTFKRKKQAFFIASRAGFALFSKDKALLQQVLQTQGGLQASLSPQLPWLQSHDVVGVVPEKTFRTAMATAKADLEKPDKAEAQALPTAKATKEMVKLALEALDRSASYFAFSMDLPEDRSLRASAKLFFRPGAPMASWAPKASVHPLLGVPTTPYALAMGGPSPKGVSTWMTDVLMPLFYRECAPGDLQSLKSIQGEIQGNVRSAAWILGAPVAPGRGLLSGTSAVLKVEDPARYMDSLERLTRLQADLAAKKPKGEAGTPVPLPVFTRNVLPGAPSVTVSTPLGLPDSRPQDLIFQGMIFGGDRVEMSLAQADEHTLVAVVGGAEVLQRNLDAYRTPLGTLEQEAGVKAVDALLPAETPWRLYLHPGGMRDFAHSVLETLPLLPGGKTLPKVDTAPPVALGLRIDAQGADLSFVATGSTLDALAKWGKDVKQLFPQESTCGD
ncbi:hypothetical protein [Holophaga foetida]|uniref:hypothetical protein n=1 Tax=Holophaga foetida TaxID=35839 RepID=UPI0002474D65|nr:hypothetical protein [Holophaga foetida]